MIINSPLKGSLKTKQSEGYSLCFSNLLKNVYYV